MGTEFFDICDLDWGLFSSLPECEKTMVTLLSGQQSEYAIRKTINENINSLKLNELWNIRDFFGKQEMFDWCVLFFEAIKKKTLDSYIESEEFRML